MIYFHANSQLPNPPGLLVITFKPKAKYRFYATFILLYYHILCENTCIMVAFFRRSVTMHHVKIQY
jgi:hypothetical protein